MNEKEMAAEIERLESRLREMEAREAVLVEALEFYRRDGAEDDYAVADKALSSLPTRTEKVLRVLDAARKLMPIWQRFCDGEGEIERIRYYLWDTRQIYDLMDAVRELDER